MKDAMAVVTACRWSVERCTTLEWVVFTESLTICHRPYPQVLQKANFVIALCDLGGMGGEAWRMEPRSGTYTCVI